MALPTPSKLGPYEVIAPLGSGGMGDVYRARDTRLGREVAIKVLSPERVGDEHRRARFAREARAASALAHPNIVTIHEIEAAEGVDFIVMELVPGQTLSQRLKLGRLGVEEALRVAIAVADALSAAHAAGIVHRDVKPANVVLRPDGIVKVLDFGIAKLLGDSGEPEDDDAPTLDGPPLTCPGRAAGTVGYMSPEQALGRAVDGRSDVFSFGLLLYEMLTGRPPFPGGSGPEALDALLNETPRPPRALVPEVPAELERVVLRCLRKEPGRRFQHMDDLKVALEELKEEETASRPSAPAHLLSWTPRRARRWPWVAAGVTILVAVAVWRAGPWRATPPPGPAVVALTSQRKAFSGSFSPEGTQIAFASAGEDGANWDIWLKIVGEAEARRLTSDPASENYPAWSPDGTQVAFVRHEAVPGAWMSTFFQSGHIHLVSPLGGATRRLSGFEARLQLSWSPDGRWLAATPAHRGPRGIHFVSVATGEARPATSPKAPLFDVNPAFSPDGRALAYATCSGSEFNPVCDVVVQPLDARLSPTGEPRTLTRQGQWNLGVAWSRDGRFIAYSANPGPHLWRVSADGRSEPERLEIAGRGAVAPAVATSRDRLVFSRSLWDPDVYAITGPGPTRPLIESTVPDFTPRYSPDGRRIAFQSDRAGDAGEIWLADADGTNLTRLTRGPGRAQGSPRWSPDGGTVAFDSQATDGHVDVWVIRADGSGLRQVTHDPADETLPAWSGDGRFLYFVSNRAGRSEVWKMDVRSGREERVTEQGQEPLESLDGRTLYYLDAPDGPLRARPVAGGEARAVVRCVDERNYTVGPRGVVYFECASPASGSRPLRVLRQWDAATGKDSVVATIEATHISGLSSSPDGRTVLYGHSSWGRADLLMIEGFR